MSGSAGQIHKAPEPALQGFVLTLPRDAACAL